MKKFAFSVAMVFGVALVSAASANMHLVKGKVTKVDASAQKLTIRHEPIKKLDMEEGMTMVFRVKDPAMLKQIKPGDDIRFDADKINGAFTVIEIEKGR